MKTGGRSKRAKGFFGCCALLLVACLLAAIPVLRERSERLTVLATYSTDASMWTRYYDGYCWETNNAQLLFYNIANRDTQVLRHDDARNSTSIFVPSLTTLLGAKGIVMFPRCSPGGKWLLAQDYGSNEYIGVDLKTGRLLKWSKPASAGIYVLWLPDGKRWVELRYNKMHTGVIPVIHSMEGPDVLSSPIAGAFEWPLGVTADLHMLVAPTSPPLIINDFDLNPHPKPTLRHSIKLPGIGLTSNAAGFERWAQEIEASPDAHRLAYMVQEEAISPFTRLLRRFVPGSSGASTVLCSIWVSNADGSNMCQIGHENAHTAAGLQWTPDGKRLSLFIDDKFYVIPVKGW